MKLSANFTLEELTVSQEAVRSGLKNIPNDSQTQGLILLCQNILEPLRARAKKPIVVNSGFRSTSINRRIGGSNKSQHCKGEAADLIIPGLTVSEVVLMIRKLGLPVDQCIEEFGAWVHVSHAMNGPQRGQYLKARRVGGKTVYSNL